jgi:hypothetical protein
VLARWVLGAIAIASCVACTTIEIRSGAESTRIERHFGLLSVDFASGEEPVVARVRSLGISDMPFGLTAGWSSQDIALPGDCRIVLWVERRAQVEALDELLDGVNDVCLIRVD